MALSNFGELKTSIASELNRDDMTAKIPDFVTMLEATVNRETRFRNRRMETKTTIAYTGTDEGTLPSDFIEARVTTWKSTPHVRLEYVTPSQFQNTYTTDTPGTPVNFTIYGDTLQIGPYPNADQNVELLYYQRLTALSADADTNWLLQYHPDVYLYGSLVHSAPWLGEDARLQTWLGLYDRAAAEVAGDDARARWNGAPVRPQLSVTIV